jgi:hypothetical protein
VHGASLGVGVAEGRAGRNEIFLIGDAASEGRKTGAYVLLIGRVDVVLIADVNGDSHAGVGKVKGLELGLAESAPFVVGTASKRGELNEEGRTGATVCASPGMRAVKMRL